MRPLCHCGRRCRRRHFLFMSGHGLLPMASQPESGGATRGRDDDRRGQQQAIAPALGRSGPVRAIVVCRRPRGRRRSRNGAHRWLRRRDGRRNGFRASHGRRRRRNHRNRLERDRRSTRFVCFRGVRVCCRRFRDGVCRRKHGLRRIRDWHRHRWRMVRINRRRGRSVHQLRPQGLLRRRCFRHRLRGAVDQRVERGRGQRHGGCTWRVRGGSMRGDFSAATFTELRGGQRLGFTRLAAHSRRIVARHLPDRTGTNVGHSAADPTGRRRSDRHTSSPNAFGGAEKWQRAVQDCAKVPDRQSLRPKNARPIPAVSMNPWARMHAQRFRLLGTFAGGQ